MIKRIKQSIALVLAMFLVMTSLPVSPGIIKANAKLKTGYAYTYYTDHSMGPGAVRMRVPKLGIKGTCCSPTKHAGKGKCKVAKIKSTSKFARVAYYYVVEKKWWKKGKKSAVHLKQCFQLMNDPTGFRKKYWSPKYDSVVERTQRYIDKALDRVHEAPPWFYVYKVTPKDSKKQSSICWKKRPVKITIKKAIKQSGYSEGVPAPKGLKAYKNKFSNIRYGLYSDEACTKLVGEWMLNKKGTVKRVRERRWSTTKSDYQALRWTSKTETHKWLTVKAGTYYIKEISSNKWFEKNTSVKKITVKWSKDKNTYTFKGSSKLKALNDKPVDGYIKLKKVANPPTSEKFKITLTSIENPDVSYTFEVPGNGTEITKKVWLTTYAIEEDLGDSDYEYIGTYINGSAPTEYYKDKPTVEVKYENKDESDAVSIEVDNDKNPEYDILRVRKTIKDKAASDSLAGFNFEVTGELDNWGTLSQSDVCNLSLPSTAGSHGGTIAWGAWQYGSIDHINAAAKAAFMDEGQSQSLTINASIDGTETYQQSHWSSGWTDSDGNYHSGYTYYTTETAPAHEEKTITVTLLPSRYNEATNSYEPHTVSGSETSYTWEGAKTYYKDLVTNNKTTYLTSDFTGYGTHDTTNEKWVKIPNESGKYTVTEKLTSAQAQKYTCYTVNPQTLTKREGSDVSFVMENRYPSNKQPTTVRIKKTTDDPTEGAAEGIRFRITGKDFTGTEIEAQEVETVVENEGDTTAWATFVDIWPGDYVIEEVGWDATKYKNSYPLTGYDYPAQELTISSASVGTAINGPTFHNEMLPALKITKVDHHTGEFLSGAEFEITEGSTTVGSFRIDQGEDGTAQATILSGNKIFTDNTNVDGEEEDEDEIPDDPEGDDPDPYEEPPADFVEPPDPNETITPDDDSGPDDVSSDDDLDSEDEDDDEDGDDGGGDDEDDSESYNTVGGTTETNTKISNPEFVEIRGLEVGKTYTITETKAPTGNNGKPYPTGFSYTFTFTGDQNNPLEIVVENKYPYHDIEVHKNVTGNLGDLTKEFEYDAVFTGLENNKTYNVNGDFVTTFNSDGSGNGRVHFKLKDSQQVTIKDIPDTATYQVTEVASDHVGQYDIVSIDQPEECTIAKDHDSNYFNSAKPLATAVEKVDVDDGTILIKFQNNRDLAAITGFDDYTPIWLAGSAIAVMIAGLLIWSKRRKRKLEE